MILIDRLKLVADLSADRHANLRAALRDFNHKSLYVDHHGTIDDDRSFDRHRPSDTGQIRARYYPLSEQLVVEGSPAYLVEGPTGPEGHGDGVFGQGASAAADVVACGELVLADFRLADVPLLDLLPLEAWRITGADVTLNFDCGSLAGVTAVLAGLKQTTVYGRLPHVERHSVYYSPTSKRMTLKAYAKGQRLRQRQKQGAYLREYSDDELVLADRLLRLELELRREWWGSIADPWCVTAAMLMAVHQERFAPVLARVRELMNENEAKARIAGSTWTPERQAQGLLWLELVLAHGYVEARRRAPGADKSAFHRWMRRFESLGIPVRTMPPPGLMPEAEDAAEVDPELVRSWDELRVRYEEDPKV